MGRAEVARIREEYYRPKQGKPNSADFDQLYELFSVDCNSFTDIAAIVGLTRERVRQLYMRHFQPLFPAGKGTGFKRMKVCTRKRVAARRENWVLGDDALEVAIAANDVGLSVDPVWCKTGIAGVRSVRESGKRIKINGHMCSVHRVQSRAMRAGSVEYYVLNRQTKREDGRRRHNIKFHILLLPEYSGPIRENVGNGKGAGVWKTTGIAKVPASILIIPAHLVAENKAYYIPAIPNKIAFHFCHPKIDFWDYLYRWDLLKDA